MLVRTLAAPTLFTLSIGDIELNDRIVTSPMTRSRALVGNAQSPIAATYYAQRASAGLIVSEATQISPQRVGYIRTSGKELPRSCRGGLLLTLLPTAAVTRVLVARYRRGEGRFDGVRRALHRNPDLPIRYLNRAPLNSPDPATFYSGEEKGYTADPCTGLTRFAIADCDKWRTPPCAT